MKSTATLLILSLLATGCANFPAGSTSEDEPASTAPQKKTEVRERKVQFGNWRVDCIYEEINFLTQCKAETYGKITAFYGDEIYQPTPVLWISWLTGEPQQARSICVFGHNYPVQGVRLQVDDNPPVTIDALNASGCVIADSKLLKQLRAGHELGVTFLRWPWGQTKASFSLNKSINALNELDRLVAGH